MHINYKKNRVIDDESCTQGIGYCPKDMLSDYMDYTINEHFAPKETEYEELSE